MLLLIAAANAPWYLWGAETRMLSMHPTGATGLDAVIQTVMLVAVDARSYPMFAALFGYGIWQLYTRQAAAGVDHRGARALLRRRHWWMLAFGLVHAALLWAGDIVGAYGLAGLVIAWLFLDRTSTVLRVWAVVLSSLLAFGALMSLIGAFLTDASGVDVGGAGGFEVDSGVGEASYLASVGVRLSAWAIATPSQAFFSLTVPVAILVGILAARHRVLEHPDQHLPLLRRTAILGIALGWGGGAIVAAQNLDAFGLSPDLDWGFLLLQFFTGLCGGLGYVAVFGLIAARLQRPRGDAQPQVGQSHQQQGRVTWALQAVGKRSLSAYLAQSVLMAPLLSAWGFGLGAELGTSTVLLGAVGTWLVTVALCCWLEATGRRGPAEWALRRLAYPR